MTRRRQQQQQKEEEQQQQESSSMDLGVWIRDPSTGTGAYEEILPYWTIDPTQPMVGRLPEGTTLGEQNCQDPSLWGWVVLRYEWIDMNE